MSRKNKYKYLTVLGLIVILGTVIRLYNLRQKGLYLWDEGIFYQSGVYVHYRFFQLFPHIFHAQDQSIWNIIPGENIPGFPTFLWKPFHVLLTFAALQVFGYRDYAGPFMSVFFAALTIIVVYKLGEKIKNRETGLLAAFMLAFSPYHLIYSRTGLQESDSSFFLVVTLLFYYMSLGQSRHTFFYSFATGAGAGITLGTSYRWIMLLPFLFLTECLSGFHKRRKRGTSPVTSYGTIILGFTLVLFLINFCYVCFFPEKLGVFERHTYIAALKQKFSIETAWNLDDPFYYFIQLYTVEKPLAFSLICFGLLFILLKGNRMEKGILPFTLLPLIFFGFVSTRLMRVTASIVPLLYLAAAAGFMILLSFCLDLIKKYHFCITAVFLLCYFIPAFLNQVAIVNVQVPYKQAISYINTKYNGKHVSTMWPLSTIYAGSENVIKYPLNSNENFYNVYKNGYRYLIVDYQKYYFDYPDWLAEIENKLLPVKAWKNTAVTDLYALDENYSRFQRDKIIRSDPTVLYIKLYDLEEFFKSESAGEKLAQHRNSE